MEDSTNKVAEAGRMLDSEKSGENHTMEQRVSLMTIMIILESLGKASYGLH